MDIASQVNAARGGALALKSATHEVMVVTGADRQTWLNGLVTCDVTKLTPGGAAYGLVVAQKGKIVSDLVLIAEPERILLVVPAAQLTELAGSFDRHLIMEDAAVDARPGAFAVWFVHGPRSEEALAAARARGASGAPFDPTGLGGAVVVAPATQAEELAGVLAGHAVMGGDEAWEVLRVERGVARFGVDFDGAMYPQEASLEKRAVSFDKGCYLGQEVVCMLELRGHVTRKLVSLALEGGEVPAPGVEVHDGAGESVGRVTSGARSVALGAPIALALVRFAHAKPGSELRVGGVRAVVVERAA